MSGTSKQASTRTPKGKSTPKPKRRVRNPEATHRVSGSEMLRVSQEFGDLVRRLAAESGTSVPNVTRMIALEYSA